MSIITLTTDFGFKDPYAAEMKGVILSLNRSATIIDVTHQVAPQNIMEGALTLSQAYPFFPEGTIHVGVVDPGVGGERRPILIKTDKYIFVGPDNGLFTKVLQNEQVEKIIHLTNENYFQTFLSHTFHGRDIFAPVAAHLTLGIAESYLGKEIDNPSLLQLPFAMIGEKRVCGKIVYKDGFGNLITNITEDEIISLGDKASLIVKLNKVIISGIDSTYSDSECGELVAIIGSMGYLEIAINGGSAANHLNTGEGTNIEVSIKK